MIPFRDIFRKVIVVTRINHDKFNSKTVGMPGSDRTGFLYRINNHWHRRLSVHTGDVKPQKQATISPTNPAIQGKKQSPGCLYDNKYQLLAVSQ